MKKSKIKWQTDSFGGSSWGQNRPSPIFIKTEKPKKMTKKEKDKIKAMLRRSKRAIKKLNDPRETRKRVMQFNKELEKILASQTDMDKVKEFLESNEMPYEQGVHYDDKYYLFLNFDKDGSVTEPD